VFARQQADILPCIVRRLSLHTLPEAEMKRDKHNGTVSQNLLGITIYRK
jgi:hypothetical protein